MNDNDMTIPQIIAAYDLVEYVESITPVKKVSSEHSCLCMFHNDTRPSMRLYHKNGKQMYHCPACGAGGDILDYVYDYNGCTSRKQAIDILTGRCNHETTRPVRKPVIIQHVDPYADFKPLPLPDIEIKPGQWITVLNPKNIDEKPLWKMRPDAVYKYDDGYVLRLNFKNGKNTPTVRWCLQLSTGLVGWVAYPFPNERRKHYGVIKSTGSVIIVEGEKAADAGINTMKNRNDASVIAWPGGAKVPLKTDWSMISGRPVILIPDNDYPGFAAMREIYSKLPHARIVDPTGEAYKFDIADRDFTELELFDWMCSRMISYDEFEEKTRIMGIEHKNKIRNKLKWHNVA